MPIPTEPVGSLPRPATLQAALADYDVGKVSREELTIQHDAACLDSIMRELAMTCRCRPKSPPEYRLAGN